MTPKVKIFGNVFPYCSMGHGVVSWPNLVEIGRCEVPDMSSGLPHKKTRAPRNSSQPPFCPKGADRAQNYLNVVTPWHVHVDQIWSGLAGFCRTYSGKIYFSAPKVIQYRLSAYNELQKRHAAGQ